MFLLLSFHHTSPTCPRRIHSSTRSVAACEYPQIHPLTMHQPVRSLRHARVHGRLLAAHLLVYSCVERTRQGRSFFQAWGLADSRCRETAVSGTERVLLAVERLRQGVPLAICTPRVFQVQPAWHAPHRSLKRDEPAFVPVQ